MRLTGVLFIALLVATAIVLFLQSEDARVSLDAVTTIATNLREAGVHGSTFDHDTAKSILVSLDQLLAEPHRAVDHTDELRTIAATTASWAEGAPTPSVDLRIAVALRSAADELRAYAIEPRKPHLIIARDRLEDARRGLAGELPPGSATDAVKDRLENLQRSQQEQLQNLDEMLENRD